MRGGVRVRARVRVRGCQTSWLRGRTNSKKREFCCWIGRLRRKCRCENTFQDFMVRVHFACVFLFLFVCFASYQYTADYLIPTVANEKENLILVWENRISVEVLLTCQWWTNLYSVNLMIPSSTLDGNQYEKHLSVLINNNNNNNNN